MATWIKFDALASEGEGSNVVHIDIEKVTHVYATLSDEYVIVKIGSDELYIGGEVGEVMQKLGIEAPIP